MKRLALTIVCLGVVLPGPAVAGANSTGTAPIHLMVQIPRTLAVGAPCDPSVRLVGYQSSLGRLILQFNGLLRWATVDTASPGWNPGDADHVPQRIAVPTGGFALDFGRAAYEVVVVLIPRRAGWQTFAVRAYLGDWDHGKPRVRRKLLGATFQWWGYVRRLPLPGGTLAQCQKWG